MVTLATTTAQLGWAAGLILAAASTARAPSMPSFPFMAASARSPFLPLSLPKTDFGSAQLSAGEAVVDLEPDFAQTVNTGVEYHVFLTPRGECEGLYVASTTASGFEVRELHHGSSSVAFDYRIVALRKNFENIRLEDHTKDPDPAKLLKAKEQSAQAKVDMNQFMPHAKPAPNTHPLTQKAVR